MRIWAGVMLVAAAALLLAGYLLRSAAPLPETEPARVPVAASVDIEPVEAEEEAEVAPLMPSRVEPWVEQAVALSVEAPSDDAVEGAAESDVPEMAAEELVGGLLFDFDEQVEEPEDDPDTAALLSMEQTSSTDTSLRNRDYPRTFIRTIHVDLTSPNHWVRLTWEGPEAASQERGPFRSSPGRGLGRNDCDDVAESNRDGSQCTPKGSWRVQGFSDFLPSYSYCRFVTWFHLPRGIAFHSHPQVPNYPASNGCVRLDRHAAQLIHNNSKIGETEVVVDGKWTFGR